MADSQNSSKQIELSQEEQKVLTAANNGLVLAKAQAYDALKALEGAEKQIALADTGRQAALAVIAQSHGFTGQVRLVGDKLIGG